MGTTGDWYGCKYHHFLAVGGEYWYGSTMLVCKPGYTAGWPGVCTKYTELPAPSDAAGSCSAGNPVQVASGAKVQTEIDLQSGEGALGIRRTYRSLRRNGSGQSAGFGWSFSFDRDFIIDQWSPIVSGSFADGSYFKFTRQPDGSYLSAYDKQLALQADGATWLLTTADGDIERYAKSGETFRLASVHSRTGLQTLYQYGEEGKLAKLTDTAGRQVTISWSGDTVAAIDGIGGGVAYEYEQAQTQAGNQIEGMARLTAVHFHDANGAVSASRRYHYEDPRQRFLLTGITDEKGIRFATYAYNDAAQTILSEHAGGAFRYTFAYPGASSRVVTDPLGTARTFAISYGADTRGRIVSESQPAGAGCTTGAAITSYTPAGDMASSTDFNGQKTCFIREPARGLELTRFEGVPAPQNCPAAGAAVPAGARIVSTRWHPDWRLTSASAAPNRIETYVYNGQAGADGRVLSCASGATLPNGKPLAVLCSKTMQATTDANGALGFAAARTGPPLVWRYTYDENGRMLTMSGPRGASGIVEAANYSYYKDTSATHHPGDLASYSNGAGDLTEYLAYTPEGLPGAVKLNDGRTLSFEYDARQRLTALQVSANNNVSETTHYDYDAAGQLTGITAADGNRTTYAYDDAHRLTAVRDAAGNTVQFELDAMGNPVRQRIHGATGELAAQALRSYDALNRLNREQVADRDPGMRYAYDKNGNLTSITDTIGRVGTRQYEAFDRLVREQLPAATSGANPGAISYGYSQRDQLVSVIDPRKLETRYQIDGLDRQTAVISRDTGTTSTVFDDAAQVVASTDAKGRNTNYRFDAAGRPLRIGAASFQYGAHGGGSAGRLTAMVDPSGQSNYVHDGFGRLIATAQTIGAGMGGRRFALEITYGTQASSLGHLSSMRYPSGNRVDFSYGSDGRVSAITLTSPSAAPVAVLRDIVYQPYGAARGWTWGNSTAGVPNVYERRFDVQNRIVAYPLGQLASGGTLRTLSYDPAGRITRFTHARGAGSKLDQQFEYDGLDRLTSFTSVGATQRFQYDLNGNRIALTLGSASYTNVIDPASNRLSSTTGPAPARRNTYDATGSMTSDGNLRYSYDAGGRLAGASGPFGTASYLYNGIGQRVAKTAAGTTTYYVYDQAGHLLGEYDGAGAPLQETIYLDDTPVAVLKPDARNSVYFVYADHLGTPRVITRASDNQMVWRWDNAAPFGEDQPDESPSRLAKFVYNPRFPGQVYDKETNTHYNYFRDYDPQSGRYVQSDPIGLDGGVNTYAYVGGNTLSGIDPLGLANLNLFKPGESAMRAAGENWNPSGVYSVAGHGSFYNMSDWNDRTLWPHELAEMIRKDPNFHGQRIVLGSCNTNRKGPTPGEPTFAERLANYLGTTVTAAGDFTYPTRGDLEKIPPSGKGGIWHNVHPNPNYKGRKY